MSKENNNEESMIRYLVTEILESAINMALSYEPMARERLKDHEGRVLRVKTRDPNLMFFLAVRDQGIQLYLEYDETSDARISLSSSSLGQFLLGAGATSLDQLDGVRMSGDQEFLQDLLQITLEFNLWSLVKKVLNNWLPEFEGFAGLIEALKNNDPAWIVRLEHLPQLANETLLAVRAQAEVQQQQLKEIEAIKYQLRADRRANRISTSIGFCLIVVAFLAHNGYLKVPQLELISFDAVVLLVLSMVILIPRMISGR